jgi:CheY-like chemotaxis protein
MKTQKVDPFLIISDINVPGEDGFNLRKSILEDKDIKNKGVPFVFWSNTVSYYYTDYERKNKRNMKVVVAYGPIRNEIGATDADPDHLIKQATFADFLYQ